MLDPLIRPAGLINFTPHTVLLTPAVVIKFISKFRFCLSLTAGLTNSTPHQSPVTPAVFFKIDLKNFSKSQSMSKFV